MSCPGPLYFLSTMLYSLLILATTKAWQFSGLWYLLQSSLAIFLKIIDLRPTLKIFLFPLTQPCFTRMGRSVGKLFFYTSQIGYPINCIVYSKTRLKRPLKKRIKIVCFFKTVYRIMQVKSKFTMKLKKKNS